MDLSPGAIDPLVREVTIKRYKQTLSLAEAVPTRVLVFHSGYDKWKYDHKIDVWLDASLKTWEIIVKEAESRGIRIAIENIFEDNPENLRLLMERMHTDHFGICFDTGHFNLFSSVSLDEWLDAIGSYIFELHIHDNDGTADQHCAPGEGRFDFNALFDRIDPENENIIFTVEAHSAEQVRKALQFFYYA